MQELFLDSITQTPIDSRVLEAMYPYLTGCHGNPLSRHGLGGKSQKAVEKARQQVAILIGSFPDEVIFTSTGTESNNMALIGMAHSLREKGNHLILSGLEHESVLFTARALEKEGYEISILPVDSQGLTSLESLEEAIRKQTILIAITTANGEVGTLQPLKEIGNFCQNHQIAFFSDGVAAVGQIPMDVRELNLDALSLAGNQFYGPPGIAAMYLRRGTYLAPLMYGGKHEEHHRPGTHNLPGIVGLGMAAQLALQEMPSRMTHLVNLRDYTKANLASSIPNLIWTGHSQKRLPHHLSFCVEGIQGEALLLLLELEAGVAASSGSICGDETSQSSRILLNMGISEAAAGGAIRFTFLKDTDTENLDVLFKKMPELVARLRNKFHSAINRGLGTR